MIGLLEVAILAGTMIAAATWLLVVLVAPAGTRPDSPSARRLNIARLWLYAPFWVPLTVLVAAIAPGVVSAMLGTGDHLQHTGHHHHLCLLHPPLGGDHVTSWALLVGLLLPTALMLGLCAHRVFREWRLAHTLVGASRPSDLGADVRILDQSAPLALTVGWRRPTILISSGLIDSVDETTLRVVLAHERAHVTRGDTRHGLFDRFAASLFPGHVRRVLIDIIVLAREQSCDAIAARTEGGRLAVAAALTRVARLNLQVPAVGVSIASGSLEARITHLLHPPTENRWWVLAPLVSFAAVVAAGAGPVHSGLEHLVSLILH